MSATVTEPLQSVQPVQVRTLTHDLYNLFVSPETPSQPSQPSQPQCQSRIHPSSTGCSMNGTTPTAFVFSNLNGDPRKLSNALTSAQTLIDMANKRGNDVHLVFVACAASPASLGSEDFEVAEELLKMKRTGDSARGIKAGNVHLVVGPHEMLLLSSTNGVMLDYLRESKVIHVVQPDSETDSSSALWIKATPFGEDIVGRLPGIGVSEATGPRAAWIKSLEPLDDMEWAQKVNHRWTTATTNPVKLKTEAPDSFQFWQALAVTDTLDQPELDPSAPLSGLEATSGAFACGDTPFGTVQRRDGKVWFCAAASTGTYWGVKTWCGGFARALRRRDHHVLDRTMDIAELQYIVNVTLSSLMQYAERNDVLKTDFVPFSDVTSFQGLLGPVWQGKRVSCWSTTDKRQVIMLLPEQYVRFVLQDLYTAVRDTQGSGHATAWAVGGTLYLDDEAEIPLAAPDLTAPEQRDFATSMGARLFRVTGRGSREMHTFSSAADPLAGRRVKWTFAAGRDLPTLAPM